MLTAQTLGNLSDFSQTDWETFKPKPTSRIYRDDYCYCNKDGANLPYCRVIVETTAAQRRAGPVASMQKAADAALNLIPAFTANHIPVQTTTMGQYSGHMEPNPIGSRAGYDGVVGPSTFGLTFVAISLASILAPVEDADVAAFILDANEATMTRQAAWIGQYLNHVADRFDDLLANYLAGHAPPSPILVPTQLPQVRTALKKPGLSLGTGAMIAGAALLGFVGLGFAAKATEDKNGTARVAIPSSKRKTKTYSGKTKKVVMEYRHRY